MFEPKFFQIFKFLLIFLLLGYDGNDTGDNWQVLVIKKGTTSAAEPFWRHGLSVHLLHEDTKKYLHSHRYKFPNPIPGQVCCILFSKFQKNPHHHSFSQHEVTCYHKGSFFFLLITISSSFHKNIQITQMTILIIFGLQKKSVFFIIFLLSFKILKTATGNFLAKHTTKQLNWKKNKDLVL